MPALRAIPVPLLSFRFSESVFTDEGDDSPASEPASAPKSEPTPTAQRNVPGAGRGGDGGSGGSNKPARGGRYPSRGGPRNVYRDDGDDGGPRNTGPVPETGNIEGTEQPGGFDGERVGQSKAFATLTQSRRAGR